MSSMAQRGSSELPVHRQRMGITKRPAQLGGKFHCNSAPASTCSTLAKTVSERQWQPNVQVLTDIPYPCPLVLPADKGPMAASSRYAKGGLPAKAKMGVSFRFRQVQRVGKELTIVLSLYERGGPVAKARTAVLWRYPQEVQADKARTVGSSRYPKAARASKCRTAASS